MTPNDLSLFQATLDSYLDVIQVVKAVRDQSGQIMDFIWLINNRKAVEKYEMHLDGQTFIF